MSYETRDNSGALFKEEKKSENGPDYAGTVKVGGKDYRIAAWLKAGNSGRKFMSLKFTPMDAKPADRSSRPSSRDDVDDVPF